ncbi:D-alanine--D-alanine ligase family protein [Aspergillus chevalieri]|uniref:ATP-grasp domain-containing protein n=1 Tax=Aspergillus chevalieri TaxID=182096 RepID=A0A7R7VHU2_ASPCH|nr:uncharacterized protein ACHE_11411S [Aspergillus chevalieri]BCR84009.1 hypothetical protein ACHE_11411S [Aspergillus chevalieri]
MAPLVIAFFYESISLYRSRGYSVEECVELDQDETIEAIAQSLRSNGYEVVLVGDVKELVNRIAKGEHEKWDLAFSISEGMHGVGREAQVPGLLEAYRIPHALSDAATLALCLDKGKTKMVLEHQGIPTAPFAVVPALWTPNGSTAKTVSQLLEKSIHAEELKDFPLFIKPACEGSSKGIYPFSKVTSPSELENGVKKLQARFLGQSILVEKYLTGNEYTVSLLGTGNSAKVLGSLQVNWSNPADGGFYTVSNKNEQGNEHLDQFVDAHNNPEVQAAEDLALRTWHALECCDVGRVDVRFGANGKPYVLELNPLPGLRPQWSSLVQTAEYHKISHEVLLGRIVESSLQRYPSLREKQSEK